MGVLHRDARAPPGEPAACSKARALARACAHTRSLKAGRPGCACSRVPLPGHLPRMVTCSTAAKRGRRASCPPRADQAAATACLLLSLAASRIATAHHIPVPSSVTPHPCPFFCHTTLAASPCLPIPILPCQHHSIAWSAC